MSADLAHWLTTHEDTLLEHWANALTPLSPTAGNLQQAAPWNSDGGTTATVSTTLHDIFIGLVEAAQGNFTRLEEDLQQFAESSDHGRALPEILRMLTRLRRPARDLLRTQRLSTDNALSLVSDLDHLLDESIELTTRAWMEHSDAMLEEREFIAQSLDSASAAADKRALQLTTLNRISQKLSMSLEMDSLLDLIGSSMVSLLEVQHVSIWLAELETNPTASPILGAVKCWGQEATPVAGTTLCDVPPTDLVLRAYREQKMLFEHNPTPASHGSWLQPGCGVVVFPLLMGEQAIGAVALQDSDPIHQLRMQHDMAEGMVNQAAIALQNARLYEQVRTLNGELEQRVVERTSELQDERDRLSTVHEIATEVSSTLDLDSLLETSLAALARITLAEHGTLLLLEAETGFLIRRAVLGAGSYDVFARFPGGMGLAGWAVQHKRPVMVADVRNDARWAALEGSVLERQGSLLCVPLVMQGEVLGVLTLAHSKIGFFNDGHLRLLMASAGAIAIGIHNANLYSEIVSQYEHSSELRRRQQTEASQMGAILQSLSDGVIVGDLYGNILSANPAAARILHYDLEELLFTSMPLHDILKRYLGPRISDMPLDELLARPIGFNDQPRQFTCDVRFEMQVLRLKLNPVLKEDGELLGALLLIRDITLEEESDRLKTEFIGTMSHELRTPMTSIKGFTQLLAMGSLGPLNDTQREFVDTIYTNTERMIALINDVLEITKIESGSIELDLRPLHLAEALSGVVAELNGLMEKRQHTLHISIPPGLPLVRGDSGRLRQVLQNLLSNAARYTPAGGEIRVEAREAVLDDVPNHVRDGVAADRRYTQIDIRDTGVGIAPHELDKVFQRFYRTENPLKIEAGGQGLGLSLVKALIELLGGRIWVASSLGEGSTFSFILPAA
ncbi:MAG: GAF domain-containing protein [Chloroflexaceae bacterium]|nr:GAF domain-containing protein [Chloroflexaceae bacterium]